MTRTLGGYTALGGLAAGLILMLFTNYWAGARTAGLAAWLIAMVVGLPVWLVGLYVGRKDIRDTVSLEE